MTTFNDKDLDLTLIESDEDDWINWDEDDMDTIEEDEPTIQELALQALNSF